MESMAKSKIKMVEMAKMPNKLLRNKEKSARRPRLKWW